MTKEPLKLPLDPPTRPGANLDAPPILSVSDLEVSYGPTQVIFGISLEVPEGGLCCLMGRNGVGKSTLLQTIVGLQPAKAGTIKLGHREITKRAPYDRVKAGIAYVPQGREAFPYLTVFENLRVVAEASEKSGADDIEQALDRFPRLRKILDRPAGFLSGGEAQQLAIARALVTRPRLLLLDEPTEGIQPSIILEIEDAIAELKMSGMSILLVEQYVDFAMRLANTYAVMDVGRIVAARSDRDVRARAHAGAHVGLTFTGLASAPVGHHPVGMQLVVDNSTGGDEQLAERVAQGLRERGFSVQLREPSSSSMFDTSVHLVSTGIVVRVQERPGRSELGTITDVVRGALRTHAVPRRRTRAVPLTLGEGGRVLTWIDAVD